MNPLIQSRARKRPGKQKKPVRPQPEVARVAIYTRKSVETGADETFTSLDAQRAAVEAYVTSQAEKGWKVLAHHYDDNGFTGAHLERPAFKRLISDIEQGKVDIVAVYRLDRLSRRQLDFLQLLEFFDARGVEFCSVTEQFSTGTPTGRLILSIVGTFAQFEREVNSERTSHKLLESRRKGLWTGGSPVLGFDVVEKRLVVNELEAKQVREVFQIYIDKASLKLARREISLRGINLKSWRTKGGKMRGGQPIELNTLSRLIQNPLYVGMIWAGEEMVEGAQPAIMDQALWLQANEVLDTNRRRDGGIFRNHHLYLLRGLLKCGRCGSAMCHVTSVVKDAKRYSSYVCQRSQRVGAWACPRARAPVRVIEGPVVDQLLALDREVLAPAWLKGVEEANPPGKNRASADLLLKSMLRAEDPEGKRAAWVALNQRERVSVLRAALTRVTFDPETAEVRIHIVGEELESDD